MVCRAASGEELDLQVVRDSEEIGPALFLQFRRNCVSPVFGAENEGNEMSIVGVGHGGVPSGLLPSGRITRHLRAGLMNAVPFGDFRAKRDDSGAFRIVGGSKQKSSVPMITLGLWNSGNGIRTTP